MSNILSEDELQEILNFTEQLVDDINESCSMVLGKGLEKSHDWDDKLTWKHSVDFPKLRRLKELFDKQRKADLAEAMGDSEDE